jgi:Arc/MetJ family transcription regulator
MRTNLVLDDHKVAEVMRLSQATTKKAAVDIALDAYIVSKGRVDLRDLAKESLIDDDYDYKKMRVGTDVSN